MWPAATRHRSGAASGAGRRLTRVASPGVQSAEHSQNAETPQQPQRPGRTRPSPRRMLTTAENGARENVVCKLTTACQDVQEKNDGAQRVTMRNTCGYGFTGLGTWRTWSSPVARVVAISRFRPRTH
eukprot:1351190-Prymnesium_polylepis.1